MITTKNVIYMISLIVISFYIHEIGHAIALWMLGIPANIEFVITALGPVLKTKWMYPPTTLFDLWFGAFFGPFFAGVVFMVVGKVKSEAYLAGGFQLLYAPFELMSWVLFENQGASNIYILAFIMVLIPAIPVFNWALNKIEEKNDK